MTFVISVQKKMDGCESPLCTSSTIHLLSHLEEKKNTEINIRNPARINAASKCATQAGLPGLRN